MLRSALIVGAVDLLIMLLFDLAEIAALGTAAALWGVLLSVVLVAPLLYWLVVRPYIADRERQHAVLSFLAYHDELTQLCNRRMLDEHLNRCLATLARHHYFGALIYFDLDGFKSINDVYGHALGDQVLVELAARLSASLREDEVIARVGGDEFVLLVANAGASHGEARQHAERLARRIRQLVRQPMQIQGLILQVGCSLGVHMLTPSVKSADLAIQAADAAMYQAKQSECDSIVFSDALRKPSYELVNIGVREIDLEHRQLDQLLEALFLPGDDRVRGVSELIDSMDQHFSSEEEISRRLGLNMTAEHLADHRRLSTLCAQLRPAEDEAALFEQLSLIGALLQEHVLGHDRVLVVPVSAEPVSA